MRIIAFHINGFGVLADVGIENLSDGLNVILGDNGAGKSTLLEFFRAVLFGFRERRSRELPRYEPLRGGSHGGRLVVVTNDGLRFRLHRTEGSRVTGQESIVSLTDDKPAPDLVDLLGGATRDVFENIFAFSLAELQTVSSLENADVQARLYAAAAGTGAQTVPDARKRLEEDAKRLYSERGRSELGEVLQKLEVLTARRRDLGDRTADYVRLQKQREQLVAELERMERDEREAESDLTRKSMWLSAWPDWQELRGLETELEAIGEVAPLPERAEERLEAALRLVEERQAAVKGAAAALDSARSQVEQVLSRLGDGWTEDRVKALDTGDTTAATIAEFGRELDAASEAVTRAQEAVRHAEQAAAEAADARVALEAEERTRWPEPPRTLDSIQEDLEVVREARNEASRLVEERGKRSDLEGRRHAAEGDVRRLREAPEPIAPPARIPLFVAIGALACASVVFRISLPAALAAFAVFIIAAAVAIRGQRRAKALVRAQRAEEIREAEGRVKDLDDKIAAADESIGKRQASLNEIGARYGVSVVSSPSDLDGVEKRLQAERDSASEYAAFGQRLHEARRAEAEAADRCDEARTELNRHMQSQDTVRHRWSAWLEEIGLPPTVAPSAAAELVERIRGAQSLLETRELRASELEEAKQRLEEAGAHVELLVAEAGDADVEAFRRHAQRYRERERLLRLMRETEGRLVTRAGSPEDWPAVRRILESTTRDSLQAQAEEAKRRLDGLRQSREAAANERGALEEKLRRLETSEEQESIAAEMASCRAAMEDILRRWAVRRLCLFILDEARQRFEREHQPAVVRRASDYLAKITGGQYTRLVRQFETGVLLAETATGEQKERTAWNRGLLEQIYLCLRLGFIEDYATKAEPLPLIMDDVFANFDPDHARRAAEAIAAFARQYQVLYMTCHPDTVRYLQEADPGGAFYRLDNYRLEPLA